MDEPVLETRPKEVTSTPVSPGRKAAMKREVQRVKGRKTNSKSWKSTTNPVVNERKEEWENNQDVNLRKSLKNGSM